MCMLTNLTIYTFKQVMVCSNFTQILISTKNTKNSALTINKYFKIIMSIVNLNNNFYMYMFAPYLIKSKPLKLKFPTEYRFWSKIE